MSNGVKLEVLQSLNVGCFDGPQKDDTTGRFGNPLSTA